MAGGPGRKSVDLRTYLTWYFAKASFKRRPLPGAETLITLDFMQNKVHCSAQECQFDRFAAIVIDGTQGLLSCKPWN